MARGNLNAEGGQALTEVAIALPLVIATILVAWYVGGVTYKYSVFAHAAGSAGRMAVVSPAETVQAYANKTMSSSIGTGSGMAVSVSGIGLSSGGHGRNGGVNLPTELEAAFDRAARVEFAYRPADVDLPVVGMKAFSFHREIIVDRSDFEAGAGDREASKLAMDRTYSMIIAGIAFGGRRSSSSDSR